MRWSDKVFANPWFLKIHYQFHVRVKPVVPHRIMDFLTDVLDRLGNKHWYISLPEGRVKSWAGDKRSSDAETERIWRTPGRHS